MAVCFFNFLAHTSILCRNVVPCIRARFTNDARLCRVLGLSLFFGCMDEDLSSHLPPHIVGRVRHAWEALQIPIELNINPVHRVPLHVYRINDTLCIDPILQMTPQPQGNNGMVAGEQGPATTGDDGNPINGGRGGGGDDLQSVLIQLQHQRQLLANMEQRIDGSIDAFRTWTKIQFSITNNNIRRFGGTIQGAIARQDPVQAQERRAAADQQRQGIGMDIGEVADYPTLSPAPRTLHELYTEWQYGIGGRKAARLWNAKERAQRIGGIKQKFYRRHVVWKIINALMNKGCDAHEAIHMVKEAYGHNCTVSQYINKIIRDRPNGGHPNLR